MLKKAGYNDTRVMLKKDQMRVGMLIGAVFVLIPVLWIQGDPEEMTYQLEESHDSDTIGR